jgi:toxin ParE1/3/4
MTYRVLIIADAEDDILDICRYVLRNDSTARGQHVFEKLCETCESLSSSPNRGRVPPELERVGISTYREIHFKPYRVIYQIVDRQVFVYGILDGRRDLQDLLERRLLREP